MNQQTIEKYARRLHSRLPWRRRSACRKLSEDASAAAVPYLVSALRSNDQEIYSIARAALSGLRGTGAVDALCALWVYGRDAGLGRIIAEQRYVAHQPIAVRVLSALQANQLAMARDRAASIELLVAARADRDTTLGERADAALRGLTDADAIDALCALWVQNRDAGLGRIIAEQCYVARQPGAVRVLSALQANQLAMARDRAASIEPLVAARADRDTTLGERADAALRGLTDADAIDALCELVIAEPTGTAAAIVQEMGYQPQRVSRRCVLFLLTGQLDRYLDLDFEFQHLRAEYQAGDEELRQRIGNVVRQSGDARLIGLFRTSRQRKFASELSEREAAIVIDVHARNRQWSEIFALLFHLPLSSVVTALDVLGKSGWRPQNHVEAALLDELLAVRSAIGEIPEAPPAPDVALGPVLARWIENGRHAARHEPSPDTLRKTLAQADPPDAIAALAALAAHVRLTADDLEAARTHRHWLVRLACLVLCDLAPQFAFSDTPTGGDGGGMWVDRLAPTVLDVAVYRRRAVGLNPDGLGALQGALASGGEKGRWACGRLIEALARHHLRHTIEVDEQMTVEIGETAIEIEIEG